MDGFNSFDGGSDEVGQGRRRSLRPIPPGRRSKSAPSANTAAEPAEDGAHDQSSAEAKASDSSTDAVFILCPVRAQGSLTIHLDGATGQPAAATVPSAPDAGRSAGEQGEEGSAAAPGRRGMPAGQSGDHSADGRNGGSGGSTSPPPLAAVVLNIEAVAVQVDMRQYAILNGAVSAVAMSQRRFRFRRERPKTAVLEDPEAWWRYAIR